jgi:medium-chain acyl-[acyl-carrier-protein] hydrolase
MFEKEFDLRYFEMDKYGCASPTTIITLLQEAAADHCFSINHGLYDLYNQNIGWILLSGFLQMERYPLYKEKIIVRTWLSNYTTIKGQRENIIYDGQRRVIGRAKGLWLFFDIERRRPIRIFDDIMEKWNCFEEESVSCDINKKIEAVVSAAYKKSFSVCRYDLDSNRHVNNLKYIQWLLEIIPDEIMDNYNLHSIEGRYIKEAQYGHSVESLATRENEPHKFIHTIRDVEDNNICANGRTVWRKRF